MLGNVRAGSFIGLPPGGVCDFLETVCSKADFLSFRNPCGFHTSFLPCGCSRVAVIL